MSAVQLRPVVVAAKQQLAAGREKIKAMHQSGTPGVQVARALTGLVDQIILDILGEALAELGLNETTANEKGIALVAHGGYGRQDVAPYSDVDLMLLHEESAGEVIPALARRLQLDICDAGLNLGFSVRTVGQTIDMAVGDAVVFTSLMESRRLFGNEALFEKLVTRLKRLRGRDRLVGLIEDSRRQERSQYGETVYMLEPNIKRSRGSLRDIQLVRWLGFTRCGETDLARVAEAGAISRADYATLRDAHEFLLRLRNELHFHHGNSHDLLSRAEQVRVAEVFGYRQQEGLLPVELFMRDYFLHTRKVRYIVRNFIEGIRKRPFTLATIFSHHVEGDFRVGLHSIGANRRGLEKVRSDLSQVLRLMDLSNFYDKRIDHRTWEVIRQTMAAHPVAELSADSIARFLSLLSHPARLGDLLHRLHELNVLEQFIPGFAHAHCLLQFNAYHKYTVDEHCLRAVECATQFMTHTGVLGDVYRGMKNKRTLHLALLLHDLGKGQVEDHSEVGLRLAGETAARLGLPAAETEAVKFLVHKHLVMSHLAFRRDTSDEAVVLRFAVEVGSPELLAMLFVLSCADLDAVGPGVLNHWKVQVLTDLYQRALRHLTGNAGSATRLDELRQRVREQIPQHDQWFERQVAALPMAYLEGEDPKLVAEQLLKLWQLEPHQCHATARFLPDMQAVEVTVATNEQLTPGIFHRLTGALTSQGMQILSAEIHTLADGVVLDRFRVQDLDHAKPPAHRLNSLCQQLSAALKDPAGKKPVFRHIWKSQNQAEATNLMRLPTRVQYDNSTSDRYTIFDIFAHDRVGLLYTITRTLFEMGVSVGAARIGTYLDQVVDVFYLTDQNGQKLEDPARLEELRQKLLAAIDETPL